MVRLRLWDKSVGLTPLKDTNDMASLRHRIASLLARSRHALSWRDYLLHDLIGFLLMVAIGGGAYAFVHLVIL